VPPGPAERPARLEALDLLRGLAVAGMIVVNSPGDEAAAYAPLRHADWHGWTVTDLIFPTFLFGVGMALGLSFPRAMADAAERRLFWIRVARRTVALVLLGLMLALTGMLARALLHWGTGPTGLAHLRFPGILQRSGLSYALVAILVVATARRDEGGRTHLQIGAVAGVAAAILLLYWALLAWVPVPGFGAGKLDPAGNLAAFVDRAVFTPAHLWRFGTAVPNGPVVYDPEGLLSTLPATTNVLFGAIAGAWWRRSPDRAAARAAGAGLLLLVAGLLLDPAFPINKRIWTSSFALLSSGFAALLLAGLALALRGRLAVRLAAPLRILGGNAILAFILSVLIGIVYGLPILTHHGARDSLQGWSNRLALGVIGDPPLASLACALFVLALILLMLWPLHRRAIHFRL
jgi:predicted acyltransferase